MLPVFIQSANLLSKVSSASVWFGQSSGLLISGETDTSWGLATMKYTFPPGFDLSRALQLRDLVNCAYNQFLQPNAWKLPDGFVPLPPALTSKEQWKLGPLSEVLAEHLPASIPTVPFGFIGTISSDVFVVIRGTKTPLEWFDDFFGGAGRFRAKQRRMWQNRSRLQPYL